MIGVLVALLAVFAVVAVASAKTAKLTAALNGKNEHPTADRDGRGRASISLNTSSGRVCWRFSYTKIATPLAAHIHKGTSRTASGPVVVPLGAKFKRTGCVSASRSVVAKIAKHPSGYYVNIHNKKYPNGAIRGQL
jgi:hypothetical protein